MEKIIHIKFTSYNSKEDIIYFNGVEYHEKGTTSVTIEDISLKKYRYLKKEKVLECFEICVCRGGFRDYISQEWTSIDEEIKIVVVNDKQMAKALLGVL